MYSALSASLKQALMASLGMCGRYTLAIDKSTIEHHFGAKFYIAQPPGPVMRFASVVRDRSLRNLWPSCTCQRKSTQQRARPLKSVHLPIHIA
jgi:hypothetical protein